MGPVDSVSWQHGGWLVPPDHLPAFQQTSSQVRRERGRVVLQTEQVTQWIKALDDPDRRDLAAQKIVERYTNSLLQVIRGRLNKRFRGLLDTEDVAQSVWRCFFRDKRDLANRSELLGLLTSMAIRRTQDAARHLDAAKRDRRREQPFLTESGVARAGGRVPQPARTRQRLQPHSPVAETPAGWVFRREELEHMVMGVNTEVAAMVIEMFESFPLDLQQVLALDIEGYSRKEIAEKLGNCDQQTVRRKKERIRRRLEEFQ